MFSNHHCPRAFMQFETFGMQSFSASIGQIVIPQALQGGVKLMCRQGLLPICQSPTNTTKFGRAWPRQALRFSSRKISQNNGIYCIRATAQFVANLRSLWSAELWTKCSVATACHSSWTTRPTYQGEGEPDLDRW